MQAPIAAPFDAVVFVVPAPPPARPSVSRRDDEGPGLVDRGIDDPAMVTSNTLREAGKSFESCANIRPNLEDVFVAATQARKAARGQAA